jgi:hypothetical protein
VALAAFTIATMPARIAAGISDQRSTSSAKLGDLFAKSAKQNAKCRSPFSEVLRGIETCVNPGVDCKSAPGDVVTGLVAFLACWRPDVAR